MAHEIRNHLAYRNQMTFVVSVSCKTCGKTISGFTYNPDDRPTMYDAINTAVKEWNQIKA